MSFFHALLTGIDFIAAYKARVAADSGTFESEQCLRAELNEIGINYSRFGIIYVSNAYKANKIYALKPINGDADLATVRATVAYRRRASDGMLEQMATGVPRLNTRFDYTCPRHLFESAAGTNVILRNTAFDNASWTKTNCTVTADATADPANGSFADSMLETVTTGQHRLEQAITKPSGVQFYSYSFYIKPNGRDWIYVSIRQSTNIINKWFNITTITQGTVTVTGASPLTFSNATIHDAGNGWRRVELNVITNSTTSLNTLIAASTGNGATADYAGDTSKGFYIWGAQLENASSNSSLIATGAAAATRNAETITTKTALSSYLGSSAGTIYFKGFLVFNATDRRIILSDGTANNKVELIFDTTNKPRVVITAGGAGQADITATDVFRSDSEVRVVIVYTSNRCELYVNSILVGSDVSVTTPTGIDRIDFTGSSQWFAGSWRMLAFSNTALTSAQAIQLSTPNAYPPTFKNIITGTLSGNPDYYAFGNGLNLNSFFPDYSIYLAKRGGNHVTTGGNGFGMLFNAKFNLWSSVFETIDDGTTYYSGHSAGLVGNQIFVQVARYTVSAGVDTFADIGYFTSVDLTTLTSAEDLRSSSSWNAFTALTTPTYNRYEAYGKIVQDLNNSNTYYSPWFEHNGTNFRLNIRKIVVNAVNNFTITNIQVHDSTTFYGEPSLVLTPSGPLFFARQNVGSKKIHLWSGSSDLATWTDEGDTNLGSGSGDCVVDTLYSLAGEIHVLYQDRGTGFMMISKGNSYAQCVALALNTPLEYHWNAFGDSTTGLGYPSIWEIRSGVFMITFCKESDVNQSHVYYTLAETSQML